MNKAKENAPWAFVLFMAWVGALIYFVQQSDGFWGFIVAVLQSIVWPVYVMHAALTSLLG